jgi:hypothetical protein
MFNSFFFNSLPTKQSVNVSGNSSTNLRENETRTINLSPNILGCTQIVIVSASSDITYVPGAGSNNCNPATQAVTLQVQDIDTGAVTTLGSMNRNNNGTFLSNYTYTPSSRSNLRLRVFSSSSCGSVPYQMWNFNTNVTFNFLFQESVPPTNTV